MPEVTTTACNQEARLAVMESIQRGILENLKELKDLLITVAQSQERIATLQLEATDHKRRLHKLEIAQATGKWTERVIWVLVSAGLAGLIKFGDKS